TGVQNKVQFYQLSIDSAALISATITRGPSQPASTATGPIRFVVHFANPVSGFTASDIGFGAGTLNLGLSATVTQNGPTGDSYFVDVSGMTGQGTVGITIPALAANSTLNGVPTAAATTPAGELVTFDNVPPTPKFTPPTIGPTNATSIPITVDFGEAVAPFAA